MIHIAITPGLWMLIIVLASIVDFLIGDFKIFLIPDFLIAKFCGLLTRVFNRGKYKNIKGLLSWFILSSGTLFLLIISNGLIYEISPVLFIIINVFLLAAVLGEKRLYLTGVTYSKLLRQKEYEKLGSFLQDDYALSLNSKYDLIRASIEECAEDGIKLIIAPIFYMFLGVFTSVLLWPFNPLILAYLYFYSKIFARRDALHLDTEFYFYITNIFELLNYLPSILGSLLYVYAGALQGFNYHKTMEIFRRNRRKEKKATFGLPIVSISGLLGIQLSITKIRSNGSIVQRIVGDPVYQPEISDISETMEIILFAEIIFLITASLIVVLCYILYSMMYL